MSKRKISFVVDRISFHELFSIPILSALAKSRGHAVQLVEFGPNPAKAVSRIKEFSPDIIGYSICSNEIERYLEINRFLKEQLDFFSLFGGAHPTFFPAMIAAEGVDAICRGEADPVLPEFLERFGTESMYAVNNFSFKVNGRLRENPLAPLVEDLDALPFPDRDLLYAYKPFLAKIPIKAFFAGRGCPYNCSYCFNHAYNSMYQGKGKILRTKSVSYVFEEIKETRSKYPLTLVKFHDDVFGANSGWLTEFARRYPGEIGLPFNCYVRPNMVTEVYCRLLKEAGCYSVCMAIECGNERLRNTILQRNMSDGQIIMACARLKNAGIKILTLNMIGLPGETEREIFETIEMNQKTGIDYADASVFQPYPGTRITEYCKEHGYLNEDARFESQYTGWSILNFPPDFKFKIFALQKLFAVLVDYPFLKSWLQPVYRARWAGPLLNLVYKFYYGFQVHRRIFASAIPFLTRVQGAILVLLAKDRGA